MTASAFLRHPALLLTAVTVAIALVWFALGYPVEMPRSPLSLGERLQCLSYRPAAANGGLESTTAVPLAQIEADLALLAPITGCIRTYMTGNGLDHVAEVARQHGMAVLQGIALGSNADSNREEIDRALALAHSHRSAIRAFIAGNEVLSKGELRASEIAAIVQQLREATALPVTYADRWDAWLNADTLVPYVDFITIHVGLYDADVPASPPEAARRMLDAQSKVAEKFRTKAIMIGEIGWPSAGRMRGSANPSPANQARVMHEVVGAAKTGNLQLNLADGIDEPWRQREEGTAGGHWGLVGADTGTMKFRWGRPISNHPLWFYQGLTGVMLAFVVFAAAFLAARSFGTTGPAKTDWRPVAIIALAGGLFAGWAIADIPLQVLALPDWIYAGILSALAFAVPPIAAAAVVRRTPFEAFQAILNPAQRRSLHPLTHTITLLLVLFVVIAIQLALGLVFDPANRDILFAPLTGPAVAFLMVALCNPPGAPSDSFAEIAAALLLSGAGLFIVFNETFWNWQALWFSALLLALAMSCWRARGVQKR